MHEIHRYFLLKILHSNCVFPFYSKDRRFSEDAIKVWNRLSGRAIVEKEKKNLFSETVVV